MYRWHNVLLTTLLEYSRSLYKHTEIRLEQTIYVVSEDVPTRHLALLVCVEGINLEDQAFNIGIKTEEFSDSCAATGIHNIIMFFLSRRPPQTVCPPPPHHEFPPGYYQNNFYDIPLQNVLHFLRSSHM